MREADRRDAIQKAEAQQASYLDKLVQQKVKERLEAQAAELANLQATRLANIFAAREKAKYHDNGQLEAPKRPLQSGTVRFDKDGQPIITFHDNGDEITEEDMQAVEQGAVNFHQAQNGESS